MAAEIPGGAVDGVNAIFTTGATLSNEQVFVDRVLQINGVDYLTSGNVITFLAGAIPTVGAYLRVFNTFLPSQSTAGALGAAFDTAGNIVNDAAVELGLLAVRSLDPFASVDNNIAQLCQFLKSAGRDIVREQQWTQSQNEYSFTSIAGQPAYALPADFLRMIDQTHWDRTNRLPLGGPLSPQEWQYLKARQVGVVFTVLFRPKQQQIFLYPDTNTPAGHVVAFEYMSKFWVQPSGQSSATTDAPSASTDKILFESHLMMRAIKRLWKRDKGLDSASAEEDYEKTLEQCMGQDSSSPVLRMDRTNYADPLLGSQNIPFTGFGG